MTVRWGLDELPGLLDELGIARPFLVASGRWDRLGLPGAVRWSEIPSDRIAVPEGVDGVLAAGGGSAIDTAKAASAQSGLPLVSVPTTYGGAEWTPYFGIRGPDRRASGGGTGARLAGVLYDVGLTLELPRAETVGTALNALNHCAEALYVDGHNSAADEHAVRGARLIGDALPRVVAEADDIEARTRLLEGAEQGGRALGGSGLALGHAMAQALGGRYGIPHGALNAICLPLALRFNEPVAPEAIRRFAEALGAADPVARTEELARLGGFGRLRDLGVPEGELPEVAAAAAARPGARANPRPASAEDVLKLLRAAY